MSSPENFMSIVINARRNILVNQAGTTYANWLSDVRLIQSRRLAKTLREFVEFKTLRGVWK